MLLIYKKWVFHLSDYVYTLSQIHKLLSTITEFIYNLLTSQQQIDFSDLPFLSYFFIKSKIIYPKKLITFLITRIIESFYYRLDQCLVLVPCLRLVTLSLKPLEACYQFVPHLINPNLRIQQL